MDPISRRDTLRLGVGAMLASRATALGAAASTVGPDDDPGLPYLTPAGDFSDVSRGDPIPHMLEGQALIDACLTPETWFLEIQAEGKSQIGKPLTREGGTALTFPALLELGKSKGVLFLKAMQCNNIGQPLGQGLWEGVPVREVLRLAGAMKNVRRLEYWGFHNNDPKQMFRSTLPINQVLDTPPGELPPFLAYRLNGEPIPLERGGPVRMVVPWAHGFKSVKWVQQILLTNRYQASDTYALENNDPESYLKTAAYLDNDDEQTFRAGAVIGIRGTAVVGWPGLDRVEYHLASAQGGKGAAAADGAWLPCQLDPAPANLQAELPSGTLASRIAGFGADGRPIAWPMRYSVVGWGIRLEGLKPGTYDLEVRTVDQNGFAQPEPRSYEQRSGVNGVARKRIVIA